MRTGQTGPLGHGFANTVFLLADHGLHSDVMGCHPPVDFRVSDEPFFDAQNVECFHPIRASAQRLGMGDEQTEKAVAISGRNSDLIAGLARKRDAEQTARHAHNINFGAAHKGQINLCRRAKYRFQHRACLWSGDGELRPLFGDRDHLHIPAGAMGLMDEFQMLHHLTGGGCRRCHHVMAIGKTR